MAFEINVQTRRPAVNVEIPGGLVFGINGATFYPAVSEDGILSWTNDRGLPNPDPVKVSGKNGESGSPGKDGLPGEDGITPHVGSNGNWFLGSIDTGVPATGPAGNQGLPGIPGEDGKSAYAYAQEAGYTGTEADFAEKLAQEPSGSGIHIGTEAPTDPNVDVWIDTDEEAPENENGIDVIAEAGQTIVVEAVDADGKPTAWKAVDFPTALKNPYALTINGTSYDGSEAVDIESIKGDKGDKGDTGQRGTGLLAVTSAPSSYTTAVGGITPKYRMALSTIKTQSGATEVLLGDTIRSSYYHYPIAYLDASYAYCTTRTSIRGATGAAGAAGADGADGKSAYAYAQDGGYTGTEAEFAEKLAAEYAGISWSETGEVVLLPETEFTFANNQSMRTGYLEIVPGNTYTVSFDGTKYQCVAFKAQLPGNSYYIPIYGLGNAAIAGVGANTGEPFLFASAPTINSAMVIAADTQAVHTVGVTYTGTKYMPIPDECIEKDYIVNIANIGGGYTADKTAKEIAQAVFSGKNAYAVYRSDTNAGNNYRRFTLCYMLTSDEDDGGGYYLVKFIGHDHDKMQLLTMETYEDGRETITIGNVTI